MDMWGRNDLNEWIEYMNGGAGSRVSSPDHELQSNDSGEHEHHSGPNNVAEFHAYPFGMNPNQSMGISEAPSQPAGQVAPQPAVLPEVAAISAQIEALNALPIFHSNFSYVIFIAIGFNYLTAHAFFNERSCLVGRHMWFQTICYQLSAYVVFVLSNYVGGEVQSYLTTHKTMDTAIKLRNVIKSKTVRVLVLVSIAASIAAGILILLSLINTFQLKVRLLKCQSATGKLLIGFLCAIFAIVFLGKGWTIMYSFTYSVGEDSVLKFLS